jgi:SAM-dependent methyltransferase
MGSIEWLRSAFTGGYDSGDILSPVPSSTRLRQEVLIGGSYRETFLKAVLPYLRPDSRVLEIGPGRGSWTRAILRHIPEGSLDAVDLVDVSEWLDEAEFGGRLRVHRADDLALACVPDGAFDFFWSFGVLCHHTIEQIGEVLAAARPKMRPGGVAVHEYGHWPKFYASGRMVAFPDLAASDDTESWWPSNSPEAMRAAAEAAGWIVIHDDQDLFTRDGICVLKAW